MSKMLLKVRGEFIRIASSFTPSNTGTTINSQGVMNNIIVHPAPEGGVYIVSCDHAALCVQHDANGYADRCYAIRGLKDEELVELSNGPLDNRWLVSEEKDQLSIVGSDFNHVLHTDANMLPASTPSYPVEQEPEGLTYVDWKRVVPTKEDFEENYKQGFPGVLSMRYLSIVSRLYTDQLANFRSVYFYHSGNPEKPAILQFPWRSKMVVVIAPMLNDNKDDTVIKPNPVDMFGLLAKEYGDDHGL